MPSYHKATLSGELIPGRSTGSDGEVQWADKGRLNSSPNFVWSDTDNTLIIKAKDGQSANILEIQDKDSNSDIFTIDANERTVIGKSLILTSNTTQSLDAADTIQIVNSIAPIQGNGAPVVLTSDPQIVAGINGQLLLIEGESNANTVTLLDGNGIHLHSRAELGASDTLLLRYDLGDLKWHEISRNFQTTEKSWTFESPSGSSGIFYADGFYDFGSPADDFNPTINLGTANKSQAAHVLFVQAAGGAGGTDTVVRVAGTSITSTGIRTAADTEDIIIDDAGAAGTYYETVKKWLGLVTITKISGPDLLCNYGFCKYWDNNNNNYKVRGLDVTWLGGANDAGADMILRHHTATGWTYNAGAAPTPPTPIAQMSADHLTEVETRNGEMHAWKRTDLNTHIEGSLLEGTIIEVLTTANKAIEIGNFLLTIRPD
jgi:hypothetical protein